MTRWDWYVSTQWLPGSYGKMESHNTVIKASKVTRCRKHHEKMSYSPGKRKWRTNSARCRRCWDNALSIPPIENRNHEKEQKLLTWKVNIWNIVSVWGQHKETKPTRIKIKVSYLKKQLRNQINLKGSLPWVTHKDLAIWAIRVSEIRRKTL